MVAKTGVERLTGYVVGIGDKALHTFLTNKACPNNIPSFLSKQTFVRGYKLQVGRRSHIIVSL